MEKRNSYPKHLLSASLQEQVKHGERVSSLAYEIAKELTLPDDKCIELVIAGFFHDIGKTELIHEQEDSSLLVEEMNSVRQHPQKGYEILKRHGFENEICEAVLYHHENYDGSGYPFKLEGEQIPFGACILRVCDVFCALTESRPYRSSFTPEQALVLMAHEIRYYDLRIFMALQRVLHRTNDGALQVPEAGEEVRGVWKTL